jgi:hypothetical protein
VFSGWTSPTFDPLSAASSSADLTFAFILQPERMARLVEYHSRDAGYPGLEEVVDRTLDVTWHAPAEAAEYRGQVRQAVERVLLDRMMAEAQSAENVFQVRAVLTAKLGELGDWLESQEQLTSHQGLALEDIRRWQRRPEGLTSPTESEPLPPGSPIGNQ